MLVAMFALLDTCSWVMLAEDPALWPLVDDLERLVAAGKIVLIVPQVVLDETKRHIPDTVKKNVTRFHNTAKQASVACDRVSDAAVRAEAKTALAKVMAAFVQTGHSIDSVSKRVLALLESVSAKRIDTTSETLCARVVARSLASAAPCHLSKNSVADALIVESLLAFADDNTACRPLVLVTLNSSDFSNPKDNRKPHPTLEPELTKRNISYEPNVAALLNAVQAGTVAKAVVEHVDHFALPRTPDEEPCKHCDGIAIGHWSRSPYGGLTWHMTCPKCRGSRDTGEFYD
jgi:hypothetical protein